GSVLMSGLHSLNDPDHGFVGDYNLIWFNNDGSLDVTKTHRVGNGIIEYIAAQPDGKFLLSGSCTMWEGQPVGNTFRVMPDGSLDTTFTAAMAWGEVVSFTVLPDGKILAPGLFKTTAASPDSLHMVRLMPDGSFDPTFHNSLEVIQTAWADPPMTWGQFIIPEHQVLSDGRILLYSVHMIVDGQARWSCHVGC
ncbi:MAG TPA: delta-60 repeat domain-containing protein, partial [Flavobacteriales bacterium]|nr:delta-60 repeat domain-containing protein [Flavobacteriales bacterium]